MGKSQEDPPKKILPSGLKKRHYISHLQTWLQSIWWMSYVPRHKHHRAILCSQLSTWIVAHVWQQCSLLCKYLVGLDRPRQIPTKHNITAIYTQNIENRVSLIMIYYVTLGLFKFGSFDRTLSIPNQIENFQPQVESQQFCGENWRLVASINSSSITGSWVFYMKIAYNW